MPLAGPPGRPDVVYGFGRIAAAVADRYGLDEQRLAQLIAGRLDTVLAGCTGNLNGPHSRAGEPCTASFLLCLSCPNACDPSPRLVGAAPVLLFSLLKRIKNRG